MANMPYYRSILPSPPAIEFASPQGKQLFSEALEAGTMEGFFRLISYYQTQSEHGFCGHGTFTCSSMPLKRILKEHTKDDVDGLLNQCFIAVNLLASSEWRELHMDGSGHFSPIGGYHAGSDMVLILDVARFKYPPHWLPLTLLWKAMDTIDETTGLTRGYMIVSGLQKAPSIVYTLGCGHESWISVEKYLTEDVPRKLRSENVKDVEDLLSLLFKAAPSSIKDFINWVAEVQSHEDAYTASPRRIENCCGNSDTTFIGLPQKTWSTAIKTREATAAIQFSCINTQSPLIASKGGGTFATVAPISDDRSQCLVFVPDRHKVVYNSWEKIKAMSTELAASEGKSTSVKPVMEGIEKSLMMMSITKEKSIKTDALFKFCFLDV
ncbi:hypothetical protein EZV62_010854 [Acer yangbiense]|uniref:glutathione gamma-glutamylcysteinyltransferase n=1 Tax=Acer yangbiense TaxID=1000413 RepID=A0A5C7I3Q6_9ROSI|nr:hypothetical protein EZV62_010854 [Acer yangbiense]